jgi:hypothetical protein
VKSDIDATAGAAVPAAADRAVRAQPLTCTGCGEKIRRRGDNFQEHWENGETAAWHILDRTCGPP